MYFSTQYHTIEVSGQIVYAATDPRRFMREAVKYAGISNAKLSSQKADLPPHILEDHSL